MNELILATVIIAASNGQVTDRDVTNVHRDVVRIDQQVQVIKQVKKNPKDERHIGLLVDLIKNGVR